MKFFQVEKVKVGKLEKSDLKSDDAFVVDSGELGVWVWQGRSSSQLEKKEGMAVGERFIKEAGYPPHTRLAAVKEGLEGEQFRSLFNRWN